MRFAAILSLGAVASALPFAITMPWNMASTNVDQASTNNGDPRMGMVQNMPGSMNTRSEGKNNLVARCKKGFVKAGSQGDNDAIGGCGAPYDTIKERTWPEEGEDKDFDKRDHIGNEMGGSNASDEGYKNGREDLISE